MSNTYNKNVIKFCFQNTVMNTNSEVLRIYYFMLSTVNYEIDERKTTFFFLTFNAFKKF